MSRKQSFRLASKRSLHSRFIDGGLKVAAELDGAGALYRSE